MRGGYTSPFFTVKESFETLTFTCWTTGSFVLNKINMAVTINGLFALCIISMLAVSGIQALECFSCSSALDSKCGVTWQYGVDGGEGDKYLVDCPGENAVCKKIQTVDTNKGETLVTRSCYNSNSTEAIKQPTKCEEIFMGKVCYCSAAEPCNGGQLLQPLKLVVVLVLSPLLRLLF